MKGEHASSAQSPWLRTCSSTDRLAWKHSLSLRGGSNTGVILSGSDLAEMAEKKFNEVVKKQAGM
jgi:hypothetical protein